VLINTGGDVGTRTPDPHTASVMLSQLSYIPRLALRPSDYTAGRPPASSVLSVPFPGGVGRIVQEGYSPACVQLPSDLNVLSEPTLYQLSA
jgi:hypothetical protein